ncbi:MAG TPA: hypothetical protein VEH86_08165 [Candidatus Acidoferrum sp.]|nr:hypothetical protein [Candidatus Acidoferrum sp.]
MQYPPLSNLRICLRRLKGRETIAMDGSEMAVEICRRNFVGIECAYLDLPFAFDGIFYFVSKSLATKRLMQLQRLPAETP